MKHRARFESINEQMADRALRVLALAVKNFEGEVTALSNEALESGYTFLGLVGMIDPPRPGVAQAIRQAQAAGIRTVMLTGDQSEYGTRHRPRTWPGRESTACTSRPRSDRLGSRSHCRTGAHYRCFCSRIARGEAAHRSSVAADRRGGSRNRRWRQRRSGTEEGKHRDRHGPARHRS